MLALLEKIACFLVLLTCVSRAKLGIEAGDSLGENLNNSLPLTQSSRMDSMDICQRPLSPYCPLEKPPILLVI